MSNSLELALVALRSKVDIVLELEDSLAIVERLEFNNQVVLDGEDGVALDPLVIGGVQLGSAALELGVGDHDVNVGGPHRVAVHEGEELP